MIDKSDKHETSGNDRIVLHLHTERWIIISLEIDTKNMMYRKSSIQKKPRRAKGKE